MNDSPPDLGKLYSDAEPDLLRHEPATVWLTGLSASGKSTVALALAKRLIGMGHACRVLDGDDVRRGLNRDLGYSRADRK